MRPLRAPLAAACLLAQVTTWAQVELDVPLVLTGDSAQRAVVNLGPPIQTSSAVTVEASVRDGWSWAEASIQDSIINLATTPPLTGYGDGLLLRFLASQPLQGRLYVNADGLGAIPLRRPDDLPLALQQIIPGSIAEIVMIDGRFILLNAPESGCPSGYTQVNARYCIETAPPTTTGTWPWAANRCADLGGKLCTWGEYVGACMLVGAELGNQFTEWEWIDDASNHTHGADQVGRTTCRSQRTALFTVVARARCCHHLR